MAWFKVDDGFYTSLKFLSIPRPMQAQAAGVWLLSGTWSADKMTDGFVPYAVFDLWEFDTNVIEELVKTGLWDHDDEREGIWFHDWADYQPMREQLEARSLSRNERAVKAANARWNKPDAKPDANAMLTDAKPMLTDAPEPVPEPVLKPMAIPSPLFDDFWQLWPRRDHKLKAITAWAKAIKKIPESELLESVRKYVSGPDLPKDKQYIPLAASWLNGERWNDEPDPVKPYLHHPPEDDWMYQDVKWGDARGE
jgi:hypothetical protein